MSKMLSEIPFKIVITIEEKEFTLECPNMGQIIDIESNKLLFTNNMYPALARSGLVGPGIATNLAEVAAVLSVLVPDFKKALKVKSIFELDILSAKKLMNIYKKEILPWYAEVINIMNAEDDEEEDIDDDEEGGEEEI